MSSVKNMNDKNMKKPQKNYYYYYNHTRTGSATKNKTCGITLI